MKPQTFATLSQPRRLSLEQKIRRLIRNYRARQRRAATRVVAGLRSSSPMKLALGLLAGWLSMAMAAHAADLSVFDRANQDYAAGHYAEAARGFEEVTARRGFSVPVLFNLGNAWLQAGQPGRAILSYERALWLSPGDDAIKTSLRLARRKAGLVVDEPNTLEKAARVCALDTFALTGACILEFLCALVFVGRLLPSFSRTVLRTLIGAGAIALVIVVTGLALRWPDLDRAVVLEPNAPARIAPAAAASASFNLQIGRAHV